MNSPIEKDHSPKLTLTIFVTLVLTALVLSALGGCNFREDTIVGIEDPDDSTGTGDDDDSTGTGEDDPEPWLPGYPLALNDTIMQIPPDSLQPGVALQIETAADIEDEHGILASQYQLLPLSLCYSITATDSLGNPDPDYLYWNAPLLGFPLADHPQGDIYIFYVTGEDETRIYPYPGPDSLATLYSFSIYAGYAWLPVTGEGDYIVYQDLAPHQSIEVQLDGQEEDLTLSLYRHQMYVPEFFLRRVLEPQDRLYLGMTQGISVTDATPISAVEFQCLRDDEFWETHFVLDWYTDFYPYLYISFPADYVDDPSLGLRYVSPNGTEVELERVDAFGDEFWMEFIVFGNTVICFPDQRGYYIVTVDDTR